MHIQGIRAAWKMKYLRRVWSACSPRALWVQGRDTYKAYHAAIRPCSQLTQ